MISMIQKYVPFVEHGFIKALLKSLRLNLNPMMRVLYHISNEKICTLIVLC